MRELFVLAGVLGASVVGAVRNLTTVSFNQTQSLLPSLLFTLLLFHALRSGNY